MQMDSKVFDEIHKNGVLDNIDCALIITHERNWTGDRNFERLEE
jgi:hypothetical protein